MKNDQLRREAKNEIPVIETNDPYIALNPITGTSRIVLIHKPRPRLRVGSSHRCKSKRDCDLFERGVCDSEELNVELPCYDMAQAFIAFGCGCPDRGYKEVRT